MSNYDPMDTARQLRDALDAARTDSARRADALHALLAPGARFRALGRTVEERAAVKRELEGMARIAESTGMRWTGPVLQTGRIVITAYSPSDRPERGYVLTVQVREGSIAEVAQQRTAPRAAPAGPLRIPSDLRTLINTALAERHPMLMGHVGPDGQPHLSFRGSVQVHEDDSLCLWIRNAEGGFVSAIATQPRVALMYRNEDSKATYQFKGRARVVNDDDTRLRIYQAAPQVERDHDFAMAGVAVVIELDSIEGYAGLGPNGQTGRVRLLRHPAGAFRPPFSETSPS